MNKLIFGNWKSNKNLKEADDWFRSFSADLEEEKSKNLEIAIFPPYTLLYQLSCLIRQKRTPIYLGAQNVSPFPQGAYTGEVSSGMLKGLVKYVLIAHSERREYFNEDYSLLKKKSDNCKDEGLITVFCISSILDPVPDSADIIAYEPLSAIGTGRPEPQSEASMKVSEIRKKYSRRPVIYGGSVNSSNIFGYLNEKCIDGVLPGKSSLDPLEFSAMIKNAP